MPLSLPTGLKVESKPKYIGWIFVTLLFLAIACSPAIKHGANIPLLLLFLISIPYCFSRELWQQADKRIVFAFVAFFILAIPQAVINSSGEALDGPVRYLVGAVVFIAFYKVHFNPEVLLWAVLTSVLVSFPMAAIGVIESNWSYRVSLGVGVIPSAHILCMILSLVFVAFRVSKNRWFKGGSVVIFFLGGWLLLKTGVRGGWISFLLVMPLLAYLLKKRNLRWFFIVMAVLLSFSVLVYSTSTGVKQRFDRVLVEVKEYNAGNVNSSGGMRLVLWEMSIDGFLQSPILGSNYNEQAELRKNYARRYNVEMIGVPGDSSHNELFHALLNKGVLGLLSLLLIYLLPLSVFYGLLKSTGSIYAIAGIGVILSAGLCGLFETPLINTKSSATYVVLMISLFHAVRCESMFSECRSG